MSAIDESLLDDVNGWDRTFFDLSSKMAEPLCWAYGILRYRLVAPLEANRFDNATNKIVEIAKRALTALNTVVGLVFAGTYILAASVVLGAASKLFRCAAVALQKNNFTHIRGTAPEKTLAQGQARAMVWDIHGECGGAHYKEGLGHWRPRIDRILDKIAIEDPDILVLHGIHDTALTETLIRKLGKETYAHTFAHLGATALGASSGILVLTKCAVSEFSYAPFLSGSQANPTGFAQFSLKANPQDALPCIRMIASSLPAEKSETQKESLYQIVDAIGKNALDLPTFFVGNISNGSDPLDSYLSHSYQGKQPTHIAAGEWSSHLPQQKNKTTCISLFKRTLPDGKTLPTVEKGVRLIDCHLIEAIDPAMPLSSDQGIAALVSGLKSRS